MGQIQFGENTGLRFGNDPNNNDGESEKSVYSVLSRSFRRKSGSDAKN